MAIANNSSKSESIMQNRQSKIIHETSTSCTVQSFSEQSSENQSVIVCQSQISPLVQKSTDMTIGVMEIQQVTENCDVLKNTESNSVCKESPTLSGNIESAEKTNSNEKASDDQEKRGEDLTINQIQENLNEESNKNDQIETARKAKNTDTKSEEQIEIIVHSKDEASKEHQAVVTQTETVVTMSNQQTVVTQADSISSMPKEKIEQNEMQKKLTSNGTKPLIKDSNGDKVKDSELSQIKPSIPSSISNSVPRGFVKSMVDALTTAPDRPYSPLSVPPQPMNLILDNNVLEEKQIFDPNVLETQTVQIPSHSSPTFIQQPKQGITPIPPIKPYNPPEKKENSIPMPEETKPYIPPDFKIKIEPKTPRTENFSPLIDALTTAPNRPFTPVHAHSVERGSLREALTIAPDRSYSPLPLNITSQSNHYTSTSTLQIQSTSSEIVRPIATQTSTQITDQIHSEFSTMQNSCKLQSSSELSAFKPVMKQVFPPPPCEEFCVLTSFPPISKDLKTNFEKSRAEHETIISESKSIQQSTFTTSSMSTQGFSSVKTAQSYFEQLDQKEPLSSTAVRSVSGLHKPDKIPTYQKKIELLPSQRGITPELCNAPAIPQRPVTPSTDPPVKSRDKSQEPMPIVTNTVQETPAVKLPQIKSQQTPSSHQFHKDTPITMTFQPVTDEHFLRVSPSRSRPSTPSMINKPAPIIPYYQMNLVTVEHLAPETHLYEPSSPETSRSPTPKLRSRSPAQGPPPNPLKAQAPRIKESTPQRHATHSLLTQATSNLRKEHEMAQRGFQSDEVFNASGAKKWAQDQPSVLREHRHSSVGFTGENISKQSINVKEESIINQNYVQKQIQSQNKAEYGSTTVQMTKQSFEEFERVQSAKLTEIQKGGSLNSEVHHLIDSNLRPSAINPKQVFPPPVMSLPTTPQSPSRNLSNENNTNAKKTIDSPSTSGANQGPVCDPTPSTGSGVGVTGRGKTFGVSSAPKRGRGVLNKAALPGSRVPLCASCNGNIRGPFITALGRIWCPEHFICTNATCRRPLQDIGFVEENGQLYCEFCFEQYIAPACDKCHAKIKGDCLNAIGKHYHPECFNCVYCGKLFGNNPFFLEDGLPYCESDWNELFTTKCFACGFPVEAGDRWVEALNNNYHSQCFNCTVCKKNLEGQSFFAKGGRPFCKSHAR